MIANFSEFLNWCGELLRDPTDPIPVRLYFANLLPAIEFSQCIGAFHALSELTKTCSASQIESNLPLLLRLTNRVDEVPVLMNCTLLRKFRVKLSSRILLRFLPVKVRRIRGTISFFEQRAHLIDPRQGVAC